MQSEPWRQMEASHGRSNTHVLGLGTTTAQYVPFSWITGLASVFSENEGCMASFSRLLHPRLNWSSLVLCDQMPGFMFYGRHGRTSALDTTSSETCGEMGDRQSMHCRVVWCAPAHAY